jgi:APA family basic amino acid/polyamine antiporter
MTQPTSPQPQETLLRRLGALDAAAIVVANVIGVGIFTTPGIVATMVPHPIALLGVWVAGGILAFAGAMAYAELATRYPRAGGEYVYLNETYGPLMGFLTGWTSFVAGFTGAIAAASVACAGFIGRFVPLAGDANPLIAWQIGPAALSVSPRTLVAIGIIAAISAIHIRGLDTGKVLQNCLTGTKVAALVILAGLGMLVGHGSWSQLTQGGTGPVRLSAWVTAMIPVMFSYSGWNAAAYVAEEIRDPGRNVPRALGLGTLAVVLLYIGLNTMYLLTVPLGSFGGVKVGEIATTRLLGAWSASALTVVTIVIILSSISAMVLAGPRVYFAMARDGLFFSSAARVHPRYRTPHLATIAQAGWSTVLVLSGTFEQLLMYTGFAIILFAGIAVSSLFVVRRRDGASPRTFAAWGYPAAPLLFCVASLLIVLNAIREQPMVSLTGMAIILSGVPLYAWLTRRVRRPVRRFEPQATPALESPVVRSTRVRPVA